MGKIIAYLLTLYILSYVVVSYFGSYKIEFSGSTTVEHKWFAAGMNAEGNSGRALIALYYPLLFIDRHSIHKTVDDASQRL